MTKGSPIILIGSGIFLICIILIWIFGGITHVLQTECEKNGMDYVSIDQGLFVNDKKYCVDTDGTLHPILYKCDGWFFKPNCKIYQR